MLGIMVGMDQKDKLLLAVACAQVVLLVILHLALCSFPVFRPVMLDIMAGMDQKDSCLEEYRKLDFLGDFTMFPYTAQCLDFVLHVMRQPTDAFGKNFPHFPDESGAVETPHVQFLDEVVVPVVCSDICPGPATQYSGGAAVAVPRQGRRFPSRGTEAFPMVWLFSRPLRSTVAVY